MLKHSSRTAAGRWRRLSFRLWIGLTIAAALYIGFTAPFVGYFHGDLWIVGVIVPPLMIVLLGIGLLWLLWLVTSSRRPDRNVGSSR